MLHLILEPLRNPEVLATSASRNDYADRFMDSRLGRVVGYLPIILILALACPNELAAAWSAWGVNLFLNLVDLYRSRYNPKVSFPSWLRMPVLLAMTVIVALVMTIPFNPLLFGPITISTLAGSVLVSMLVGKPFTLEQSAHQVTDEVRNSPEFLKFNYVLSGFWLFLFVVMTVCVWCGFALCDATCETGNTCQLVLSTIIPIAVPVLGFLLTPSVVEYLKSKGGDKKRDQPAPPPGAGRGEDDRDPLLART